MRTFVAFLVVPLVVAGAWGAYAILQPGPLLDRALEFLVVTAIGYSAALTLTFLLGLPLFLMLRRFDLISAWTSGLSGIALGGIGSLLYSDLLWFGWGWGCVLGGLAGLIFWLIWRRRPARPRLIDKLVLARTSDHWQNLLRVISNVVRDADSLRLTAKPDAVADRMSILVKEGRLECRGDFQVWKSSEVRVRS